jgi:hypothetical protein
MRGTDQLEFEFGCADIEAKYYRDGAEDLIRKLVPAELLSASYYDLGSQRARFAEMVPLLLFSDMSKAPCALSILLLSKYRQNGCNFFYDMISRWLLPGKKLNVELFFASDVRLPHLTDELLSVAEIVVQLRSHREVEEVRRNLETIETEIRLGILSDYHARRILEFKGLSSDGKTAMIQEKIGSLIQSRSKDFDREIFARMQQYLVSWPEPFKIGRDYHHLSRIISNLHSVRKVLEQSVQATATSRHVVTKFFKTKLKEERPVLGILVGLNFLHQHEVFEQGHLLSAIRRLLPQAKEVEHSYFSDKDQGTPFEVVYLEIERGGSLDFTLEEVQLLKGSLPDLVRQHVEQLTHPLFMPRNEEEVMKNAMVLSRELHSAEDLGQVHLSFQEQKGEDLIFTVVLVRSAERSIETLVGRGPIEFEVERVRILGEMSETHKKEASIIRATLPSRPFLRPDHSVDLVKARQRVLSELIRVLGPLRDYNGGMIEKEAFALLELKEALGRVGKANVFLLEKFFYGLQPVETRTSLSADELKKWFLLLMQATKVKRRDWVFSAEEGTLFAVFPGGETARRERLLTQIPAHRIGSFTIDEPSFTGLFVRTDEASEVQKILSLLD